MNLIVHITKPPRGPGEQADRTLDVLQRLELSWSWGIQPATAVLHYVSATSMTEGSGLRLEIGGHVFYGICRRELGVTSSGGHHRALEFADLRELLKWDHVIGAFNLADVRMVGGVRQKRYRHLLPAKATANQWSVTDAPYSARQILDFMFNAPTVETRWGRTYHALQEEPVYEVDFRNGRRLDAAVSEVTEKQGLVLSLFGAYGLVWARKGEGTLPPFPAGSDNRRLGRSLTGAPTRITLLGDANLYQICNIPLTRDWLPAWEGFYDVSLLANYLYQYGEDPGGYKLPGASTAAYKQSELLDPEQMIGRQRAAARALTITVREFADLRQQVAQDGETFRDRRKSEGRSRMDLPAALYIKNVLFRAFRLPDDFSFTNLNQEQVCGMEGGVPTGRVRLLPQQLCRVSHDYASGVMTQDAGSLDLPDGCGYAVVKGYQLGADVFRVFRPDRFNLTEWLRDVRQAWAPAPFQIDDSGDGDQYLVFDQPIFNTSDLLTVVDGYAVVRADAAFTVPEVKAALTLSAERFWYRKGSGGLDGCEYVTGLNAEALVDYRSPQLPVEIPYADGQRAGDKADALAEVRLSYPWSVADGGYDYPGCLGVQLTPMLDRVMLNHGPSGTVERVDFTQERTSGVFEPERDFERRLSLVRLFSGQEDTRRLAEQHQLLAGVLRQAPALRQYLQTVLRDFRGEGPTDTTPVSGGSGTLPAGTPLWKAPTTTAAGGDTGTARSTLPVMPAATTDTHTELAGVVLRVNEDATGELTLQTGGVCLARVKGPVSFGGGLTRSNGHDYFVSGGGTSVVMALQDIDDTSTRLIRVMLGGGAGGNLRWEGEYVTTREYAAYALVRVIGGVNAGAYLALTHIPAGGADAPWNSPLWSQLAKNDTLGTWG